MKNILDNHDVPLALKVLAGNAGLQLVNANCAMIVARTVAFAQPSDESYAAYTKAHFDYIQTQKDFEVNCTNLTLALART